MNINELDKIKSLVLSSELINLKLAIVLSSVNIVLNIIIDEIVNTKSVRVITIGNHFDIGYNNNGSYDYGYYHELVWSHDYISYDTLIKYIKNDLEEL